MSVQHSGLLSLFLGCCYGCVQRMPVLPLLSVSICASVFSILTAALGKISADNCCQVLHYTFPVLQIVRRRTVHTM